MSNATELAEIERQITHAKQGAEIAAAIQRLQANRDFRKIIIEAFMLHECARYAQESSDPALTAEQRADAMALAQAAGHLKRFLVVTEQMATSAAGQLVDLEEAAEQLRAED